MIHSHIVYLLLHCYVMKNISIVIYGLEIVRNLELQTQIDTVSDSLQFYMTVIHDKLKYIMVVK